MSKSHSESHGGHGHSHFHDIHGASKRHLWIAFALISTNVVIEVIGGILSGSLALLSGAGHLAADAASIGLALFAIHFAERKVTAARTFGYRRVEILAALAQALSLWVIVVGLLFEVWSRLSGIGGVGGHHHHVDGSLMFGVGSIGLLINVAAAFVLAKSVPHSVNVEGAYTHVLADLLGAVTVVISGALIWAFAENDPRWNLADPIASFLLCMFILRATWGLLKKVVHVLLEGVPAHIDVNELCQRIEMVPHVTLIHDIHVWTIVEGSEVMSAHILIDKEYTGSYDELLAKFRAIVRGEFGIGHMTIQLETSAKNCIEETHHVDHLLHEWKSIRRRKKRH